MTQKKQTGTAFENSRELLQLFIDGVSDYAICTLAPDGTVLTWNSGAKLLIQYEDDEIMGQSHSLFYPEEDRAAGKPARLLREAEAKGRVEDQGWRVKKDGSRFWADVVITALRDDSGRLRGFGKVTRNLTERKRAEEALIVVQHDLEQRVEQRTADLRRTNEALQEKIVELEKFADAVVGRELRMIELEKEVERLRSQNPSR
ncbi:MAG TPA: PAS domain S-box protein [Nitrospirales bacterium]|nr:PAS domain S-box protein [Nitrospirales bacterium]